MTMQLADFDHSDILVVLATWNGQPYVAEQIESIQSQTETNWTLLIRDDGSDDATKSILNDFCRRDNRIELLTDSLGRLGPSGCFRQLMSAALSRGANYVFIADQDDVWAPEKMAEQLALMSRTEQEFDADSPTLIHTDLAVTDAQLDVFRPSFNEFSNPPNAGPDYLSTLLERNFVPGCSMLVNRSLLQLSMPFPDSQIMYDHWLTLCAAVSGRIRCVPQPLLKYRRHDNNVTSTGTPPTGVERFYRLAGLVLTRNSNTVAKVRGRIEAARMLLRRVSADPHGECPAILVDFCQAFDSDTSVIQRIRELRRLGLPHNRGRIGKLLYYLHVSRIDIDIPNAA